jgi:hypothetical protein
MKPIFTLFLAFLFFNFEKRPAYVDFTNSTTIANSVPGDSAKVHFTNYSSLKHLPSVLRDLSFAFHESVFEQKGLLSENGFNIDLYDVVYKNFDTSATVMGHPGDAVYCLKLNRTNRQASDRALAVTLIHEIMHCVLMDIDRRGRYGDKKALSVIEQFNRKIRNPFGDPKSDFFSIMNKNDAGQHELMYQLFYEDMVSLLERFAEIHKPAFWQHQDAELLMWSGLQSTSGFQKLSFEEKKQIEIAILTENGIPVSLLDY